MKIENITADLKERGFIVHEGGGTAQEFLAQKRTVYLGIDPTAASLHVGNLVPIFMMKHLADAGHTVVFLVGGGTGMIGDPRESGERQLLDLKIVAQNKKAITAQLASVLGKKKFKIYDNYDWLRKVSLIEFLRDTGKHFTVNQLIKRDIIKKRLDTEEDSISYTEFSYSLLQGYDFWHLYKKYGVDLQVGGSDQWANIISGVELVRRREGGNAYALTTPIITDKKTGKKFGESEGNAVWLDPKLTSPFAFYQFWLNVSDEGLPEYLKIFTFLSLQNIAEILAAHEAAPHMRIGQKALAHEITTMIHGVTSAESASRVSEILYGAGDFATMSKQDVAFIRKEVPLTKVAIGTTMIDILTQTGLATSKGEARRLIEQKGVAVNEITVVDIHKAIEVADFKNGIAHVRRGKKVALIATN